MNNAENPIHATSYRFSPRLLLVGVQMLFVAFGALVLMPLITGLDPNVALLTAGAGTLLFQIVTRGKVPVFLASSFAFIAPIAVGVERFGLSATMGGLMAAGLVYLLFSFLVRSYGVQALQRVLPPLVTGPVIMVIGLSLSPVAINMATAGSIDSIPTSKALIVAFIALSATIATALLAKGLLRLVPIVIGITTGYLAALALDLVDFSAVQQAAWFAVPSFTTPSFHLGAILLIIPIAIASAIEHVGDVAAISGVTGKDYLQDPGLDRTLLGDGLATSLAALLGGPPNTTYSEVTGAVTLTKAYNPAIMTIAAVTAIILAFVGKIGAFLQTIPAPVMGGILIILFGSIVVVGMNSLVQAKEDLSEPRRLIIVAVILIFGVGGLSFDFGNFALEGIGLAAIAGMVLNLVLPRATTQETNEAP